MSSLLDKVFDSQTSIDRKSYLILGISFTLLKYLGEAIGIYLVQDRFFPPWAMFNPIFSSRYGDISNELVLLLIIVWQIPFIVIGILLTMRRCIDAKIRPWWSLLFFIPFINIPLILFLCSAKSHPVVPMPVIRPEPIDFKRPLVLAVLLGMGGTLSTFVMANLIGTYGFSLFLLVPFLMGLVPGFYFAHRYQLSLSSSLLFVLKALAINFGSLLLFGLEGVLCIVMALPLALVMAGLGVMCGRLIATSPLQMGPPKSLMLILPIVPILDQLFPSHRTVVESEKVVEASPEEVWPHVVGFSKLSEPNHWLFKLGIAAPTHATIKGSGVGATRYCHFTTGTFVEPITHWEEPYLLSFDVEEQPLPMDELSLYEEISAPHLNGFFRSEKGSFILKPLPTGQTLLIGKTWYASDIHPGWYWDLFGRFFISTIHNRVLDHIANLAESSAARKDME